MGTVRATSERNMPAPRERVWAVLRDYGKRPDILTDEFQDFSVESGGEGAGTVVRYRLNAGRRERAYRMEVEEPEPGSVLRERDTESSLVTTWSLSGDDALTRVELASEWEGAGGIGGFFERTFAPGALSRIYDRVLERLEAGVAGG
jgi:hypothetical protein